MPISTAATTAETWSTIHPAVTNGRPYIRDVSCPTVWIPSSTDAASLCLSAKSWAEWRARKNAKIKRRAPSIANRSPTGIRQASHQCGCTKSEERTYCDRNPDQRDEEWLERSQVHLWPFDCRPRGRCAVELGARRVHLHLGLQRTAVDGLCK